MRTYILFHFKHSDTSHWCVAYFLDDRKIAYTVRFLRKNALLHGRDWVEYGTIPDWGTTHYR